MKGFCCTFNHFLYLFYFLFFLYSLLFLLETHASISISTITHNTRTIEMISFQSSFSRILYEAINFFFPISFKQKKIRKKIMKEKKNTHTPNKKKISHTASNIHSLQSLQLLSSCVFDVEPCCDEWRVFFSSHYFCSVS